MIGLIGFMFVWAIVLWVASIFATIEAVSLIFWNNDLFEWVPDGASHTETILFALLLLCLAGFKGSPGITFNRGDRS